MVRVIYNENNVVILKNMFGKIIGIIVGIALILAGATGKFVLKGTDSSVLLIIAGIVLLIVDIVSLIHDND